MSQRDTVEWRTAALGAPRHELLTVLLVLALMVAVIAAVRVSDSGDVDPGVGKCHGTTATTLTTSVTAQLVARGGRIR